MVCFFWCLLSVQTTYSTMCKILILGDSHDSSRSTKSASRLLFLPSVWNHLAMCLSLISFPGLPTVQFWSSVLIACSMQNGGGLVHFITWMTSMSTQINNKGGRGTRTEKVFFVHFLCSVQQAATFSLYEHSELLTHESTVVLIHVLRSPSPSLSR